EALQKRIGVGHANVLDRRPGQSTKQVKRLFAGDEHAREIIKCSLRIRPSDRLMKRRNEVVMALAVLVVDRNPAVQQVAELGRPERLRDVDREQSLDLVQDEAAVAISTGNQRFA